MSLEATHIRFANELKNQYSIDNFDAYISGAIYPDSRYITKANRETTHGDFIGNKLFANTSFKMGWQSHYFCDMAFNKVKKLVFPNLSFAKNYTDDDWITSTAIKILQDINDFKSFDIGEYLLRLDYTECPNGEDQQKMKDYNLLIKNFYSNKTSLEINDYKSILLQFGIKEGLCDLVMLKTKEFNSDTKFMHGIEILDNQMLKEFIQTQNKS